MAKAYKQQIAVAGALAYDQISSTDTALGHEPVLNCKLVDIVEEFGGCGGNIAYNLAQLGCAPVLFSCSGVNDDGRYLEHLHNHNIATTACLRLAASFCARAVILTDTEGKQFTAFYPGPVPDVKQWRAHLAQFETKSISIFIQAPYPPALMLTGLEYFSGQPNTLKIWAPGQYADQLTADETQTLVPLAHWIVGNAYEVNCLASHCDLSRNCVITTNGDQPVRVNIPGKTAKVIEVQPVIGATDPTGCGDAFVAGLAFEIAKRSPSDQMRSIDAGVHRGNTLAAACLTCSGAQQHVFEPN